MKRRTTKAGTTFLGLWIPGGLAELLHRGVQKRDTDKSKFVREAIREKISREEAAAR